MRKKRGGAGGFPPDAYSRYLAVLVLDFFLLRQRTAPTTAMTMITIGIATTSVSVDEDDTVMGLVSAGWADVGCQRILPFNQSACVVVISWNLPMSRVVVPFLMLWTIASVGTTPVKLARYHTVPKAGGAGAETWYLLELSVMAGAKSFQVLPPSVLC